MQRLRRLWLPFLIILVPGVIFSLCLPYFPVDETRYLSVAWEMKQQGSFLVPLQNSLPYSHKPPLLFWLVNLNWLLLGVNEETLRFIPILFSLGNVALVYRIALLLWEDEEVARSAALVLSSTVSYLVWSALIMFDVVLTFWSLLALWGVLRAARGEGARAWVVAGAAIGGGLLTKGPAVLVYILPAPLFSFLWLPAGRSPRRWYGPLFLALLLGAAVLLMWLVPAVLAGGEAYRKAILWGQTVDRIANSFAHKRPFWWYLPWLPVLLFPWILLPASWRGSSGLFKEWGSRFVLIWGLSTVAIFSAISGKQVHYLIPALPAFSLLIARNLRRRRDDELRQAWHHIVPIFYTLLGIVLFALPSSTFAQSAARAGISEPRTMAYGAIAIAVTLFLLNRGGKGRLVPSVAASSLALSTLLIALDGSFLQRYDLHDISATIRQKQEEGYSILHKGKYHGQFHFLGRLKQPLVTVHDEEEIRRYAAGREKVALITYERGEVAAEADDILLKRPFRGQSVVLWSGKGIRKLMERDGAAPARRGPLTARDWSRTWHH